MLYLQRYTQIHISEQQKMCNIFFISVKIASYANFILQNRETSMHKNDWGNRGAAQSKSKECLQIEIIIFVWCILRPMMIIWSYNFNISSNTYHHKSIIKWKILYHLAYDILILHRWYF